MISNFEFDFTAPLGRNRKNQNRTAVTGMTMTVYDSRFSLTNEVLESLDNPKGISIYHSPDMEAFLIRADENGHPVSTHHGKQFSQIEVKKILQKEKGCDFKENFYRLQNGRKYGQFVVFSTDDMIEVKREVRNGKH